MKYLYKPILLPSQNIPHVFTDRPDHFDRFFGLVGKWLLLKKYVIAILRSSVPARRGGWPAWPA